MDNLYYLLEKSSSNSNKNLEILGQFGCEFNCFADVDADGAVTVSDVLLVLAVFGEPCPN